MTKKEQQALARLLKVQLAAAEQMWEEDKSHAYIVGYLQGVIKSTIFDLENQDYKVCIFIFK